MVKAKALMAFSALNGEISAKAGEILNIKDEKMFLDLVAAGFVTQVDRVSVEVQDEKAEAVAEAKAEAKRAKK